MGIHPYGKFGGAESNDEIPGMEHYQRQIYGDPVGRLAHDLNASNSQDLSRTAESIAKATHTAVSKFRKQRLNNLGAGQLADSQPSRSEYITPHKPNTNWGGMDPDKIFNKKNSSDSKEKDEEKEPVKEQGSKPSTPAVETPTTNYGFLEVQEPCDNCKSELSTILRALRKNYPRVTDEVSLEDIKKTVKIDFDFPFVFDSFDGEQKVGILEIQLLDK